MHHGARVKVRKRKKGKRKSFDVHRLPLNVNDEPKFFRATLRGPIYSKRTFLILAVYKIFYLHVARTELSLLQATVQ